MDKNVIDLGVTDQDKQVVFSPEMQAIILMPPERLDEMAGKGLVSTLDGASIQEELDVLEALEDSPLSDAGKKEVHQTVGDPFGGDRTTGLEAMSQDADGPVDNNFDAKPDTFDL